MIEIIAPVANTLNAPFLDGAQDKRLVLPHCAASGRAFWPPSPVSPFIQGAGVTWRPVAAEGVVRAVAIYRRVFSKAFEPLTPYGVALVELPAGVRLQAHVARALAPDAPKADDRVELNFVELVANGPKVLVAHLPRGSGRNDG